MTTDTLKNTWHNLWPATLFMEESDVEENNFKGFAVETNEVIRFADGFVQEDCLREWMDCDADLPIVNHTTDNEIIEMVTGTNVDVEDSDDENKQVTTPCLISLFHWRSTTSLTTLPTLPDARSHLLPLI